MSEKYVLAPSLRTLRNELNARWPNRDKALDGWIGDAAHRARKSEHNPDKSGIVRALDITAKGIDTGEVLSALVSDPRVAYVIHDGYIYSATYNFVRRKHNGDPHTRHIHVSILNNTSNNYSQTRCDQAAASVKTWGLRKPSPSPRPSKTLKAGETLRKGDKGDAVKSLQRQMNAVFPTYAKFVSPKKKMLDVDGIFGSHTEGWIKEFQGRSGIKITGVVDALTVKHLKTCGVIM